MVTLGSGQLVEFLVDLLPEFGRASVVAQSPDSDAAQAGLVC